MKRKELAWRWIEVIIFGLSGLMSGYGFIKHQDPVFITWMLISLVGLVTVDSKLKE